MTKLEREELATALHEGCVSWLIFGWFWMLGWMLVICALAFAVRYCLGLPIK